MKFENVNGVMLVLNILALGLNLCLLYGVDFSFPKQTSGVFSENCSNQGLIDTADCLNDYVREIFVYNLTPDSLDLTLEDLKTRGGDCRNWAKFYQAELEGKGFDTEYITIPIDSDGNHAFLIAYSEEGYVVLDQKSFFYTRYGNENENQGGLVRLS